MNTSRESRRKTKIITSARENDMNIDTSDKATRRVIAPYVKIIRKTDKAHEKEPEYEKFNFYIQNKPSVLLHDLTSFLSDNVDLVLLLHETADVLKTTTKAAGVTLYMVDSASEEIYQSQRNFQGERHKVNWKIQKGSIVAAYVAYKREYLMVDDILGDDRFPAGVGYQGDLVKSVLCVPIVTPDGNCYAVIELYRTIIQHPFNKDDLKICIVVTGWVGAAIHQNHLRLTLQRQQELNDYLLDLTKCYFAETVAIEKMITEIVKFAKSTLGAERGTFFIIDEEAEDLAAEVFEEGVGVGETTMHKKNVKVRLAKDRSIAGLVARSGETVNIRDAYNDPKFFTDVEEKTGFITRSILCMPIVSVDNILGVVQVINKINGVCFTASDENLFKTFSVYCALALHYTRLHQKMFKTDKINESNLKLLKLQLKPCSHDVESFTQKSTVTIPYNFAEFRWYVSPEEFPDMPQLVLHMITEVVGKEEIHVKNMLEFILTVKKCYRNNPYHNFEHAFNVTHCMFIILMRNKETFYGIEIKSLIIAALCHDLDHGGFTNNFLQLTDDTLAQLYDESILENYHYRVAMTILNGLQIYNMTKEDYNIMSKELKDAILATDLASYFKFRMKLQQLLNGNMLDIDNARHRTLIKAICMTSSDLSGNCKPFLVAKNICESVYKEFYNQGDLEKKMGLTPLSLMDREKSYMVAEDQVQFLTVIVLPCMDILQRIFPNTSDLHSEAALSKKTWQEIISLKGQKSWRQDDSVVDQTECI
ncbi:cAMP and cAMP-inhibited cGMP 3',5'-cyclic phosphodiesterase 10A-like [Diabrotica undecimpunctata]|uniref:cAMP and cAMP-inhibited cGMP 3',5'-cyclic phosphodiesterase 10A-like n=1 Tax=Diabrotica undecimpunctata TaxID=50387 RepID=UPI003B635E43